VNNPYQSPTTSNASASDNRRIFIALIPFIIAVPGLIVATVLWFWPPSNLIAFGIVGAILIFDLPVCVLVVIQWLAKGEPPGLSLSPLVPCREEREFHRNLRERPKLNDDEFYDTFYANSRIPKRLPVQLRTSLENAFGLDFGALHPTDNLIYADVEVDWADVIFRVKRDFDIVVPDDMIGRLDGTFDSLLQYIAEIASHCKP